MKLRESFAKLLKTMPAQKPRVFVTWFEEKRIGETSVPRASNAPFTVEDVPPTTSCVFALKRTCTPGSMVRVVTPSAPEAPLIVTVLVTTYGLPRNVHVVSTEIVPPTFVADAGPATRTRRAAAAML